MVSMPTSLLSFSEFVWVVAIYICFTTCFAGQLCKSFTESKYREVTDGLVQLVTSQRYVTSIGLVLRDVMIYSHDSMFIT